MQRYLLLEECPKWTNKINCYPNLISKDAVTVSKFSSFLWITSNCQSKTLTWLLIKSCHIFVILYISEQINIFQKAEQDYIILYYIILYYIILYYIILYCIVLYCIVLYCIVLYCIVLYCIILSWHISAILYHFRTYKYCKYPNLFTMDCDYYHKLSKTFLNVYF